MISRAAARGLLVLAMGAALLPIACTSGPDATSQPVNPTVVEAVQAYNRGDVVIAFRLLREQANRGDSDAQVNLGYMYARGDTVAQNQAEALRLYELSAAQGNGEGMNAIGYKYQYGTGVVPDIEKAVHWYCAAIAKGNPRAMNNLAFLLSEGKALPRDLDDAHALWLQSAERGHVNGMYNTGITFLAGEGVAADRDKAMKWLLRAAERGQPNAQHKLAMLGDQQPWPPPVDYLRVMELQPRNAAPGRARICGALIS